MKLKTDLQEVIDWIEERMGHTLACQCLMSGGNDCGCPKGEVVTTLTAFDKLHTEMAENYLRKTAKLARVREYVETLHTEGVEGYEVRDNVLEILNGDKK